MMRAMDVTWIILPVLLGIGLWLLIGLALIVIGLVKMSRPGGPSGVCGACGYSVEGLLAMTCPECGVDLRRAGIRQPGSGGGKGFLLSGVAMVVLVLVCGVGLVFMLG